MQNTYFSGDNTPVTFVYHAKCNDGLSALGVALYYFAKVLGRSDFDVVDGFHQRQVAVEPFTDRAIVFLDFCYPRQIMEQIAVVAESITIIDHHVSAYDDMQGFSCDKFNYIYDDKRCGAMLAWDSFFMGKEPPKFLTYIQDRDLWTKQYPESEYQSLALRVRSLSREQFVDLVFAIIDEWLGEDEQITFNCLVLTGQQYHAYHWVLVKQLADTAYEAELDNGVKVLKCNAPLLFASDLGDLLSNKFGVAWIYEVGDHYTKNSLRVAKDFDFDASEYAKTQGGGGHKKASGWRSTH